MIQFSKLKRENIFGEDFRNFENNNILEFGDESIIVLYGPNGTGKTSLAKILNSEEGCEFSLIFNNQQYTNSENNLFHIINDQNGRNLIAGETKDFLLGDDIRREYYLKEQIDQAFEELFKTNLFSAIKNEFGISKKTSKLISYIEDENLRRYLGDIANSRSKGDGIDRNEFIEHINSITEVEIEDYNENKLKYLIYDLEKSDSLIEKIKN